MDCFVYQTVKVEKNLILANSPTLYLLDASIYIFRAWFGYPDTIRDRQGRPVNAVLGYWRQLLAGLQAERPEYLLAAFDESLFSGFRHQLYPAYKANRALPDADLAHQLALCRALTEALGLACHASRVYEADDILYSAAVQARSAGFRVKVVSRDKDLAQIVTPGDSWDDWAAQRCFDHGQLVLRWGVDPARIPDVQALAGDAVDNIPGVPSVGLKTATALIRHFGDIHSLLANTEQVALLPMRGAARLSVQLQAHAEQALLYHALVRLHEADCTLQLDELRWQLPAAQWIPSLLDKLGLGRPFHQAWTQFLSLNGN